MNCTGCTNDFYNRRLGGCPSLASARESPETPLKKMDATRKPPPDYGGKTFPVCYQWAGYVMLPPTKVF